jgi:hypothetical protein
MNDESIDSIFKLQQKVTSDRELMAEAKADEASMKAQIVKGKQDLDSSNDLLKLLRSENGVI